MDRVEDIQVTSSGAAGAAEGGYQAGGFLMELSLDWIVLRASENVHRLLGESHVTLIGEPLGKFVRSQALHDLRNLFSKLSGMTGVARAYRVRLAEQEMDLFDIAFQLVDGRVLLEAVRSPSEGLGEKIGSVGGLIEGLATARGVALLDGGARRMRALTGFDRVNLNVGGQRVESSRGGFSAMLHDAPDLPPIVADSGAGRIGLFPRVADESSVRSALMRAPTDDQLARLREAGAQSVVTVAIRRGGEDLGHFICERRTPCEPSFELHAAAELFAQMFAMQLEIDRLS